MGRLFTYMVKAAAGQQPAPYTGYYGVWGSRGGPAWATGVYSVPTFYQGSLQDRYNAIDRLFSASKNVDDWNALAGGAETNWGTNYLTAIDTRFTSPEAIYNILSANPAYLEAIRHLANTGSEDKLGELLQGWRRDDPNFIGDGLVRPKYLPGVLGATDYDIADKVGNAQLIINNYLAYEASIKRAAEEARKKAEEAKQPAAPQPAAQPAAAAPKPATAPVQAPAPPNSSAVAAPVKKFGERVWPMVRNVAQQVRYALQPELKVRDTIQQNIDAGRSMYDGMTASTRGMTAGQRHALTTSGQQSPQSEHAAYTGSGLRMVGHSADGRTRTYVGKSGRGRITVGDNAQAGHYRGVGAADTNPRSNYTNLRQPTATRPVTPPTVSSVRPKSTASRR